MYDDGRAVGNANTYVGAGQGRRHHHRAVAGRWSCDELVGDRLTSAAS
jgi:hypothetical protein